METVTSEPRTAVVGRLVKEEQLSDSEKAIIKMLLEKYPDYIKREIAKEDYRLEHYFGVCSVCGKDKPYCNIHRSHYFYCDEHKKMWSPGSNLFSDWREEDENIWEANSKKLEGYEIIDGYEYFNQLFPEEVKEKVSAELPF